MLKFKFSVLFFVYLTAFDCRAIDLRNFDLVWEDDFSGFIVDDKKWTIRSQVRRDSGSWLKENVYVKDGFLVINIFEKDNKYYSGGLDTAGKFENIGGYYEIRCKFDVKSGFRPAFWLTTNNVHSVENEGVDGTEIDVFEYPGRDGRLDFNLHWDGYEKDHKTIGGKSIDKIKFSDWTVVGLYWGKKSYKFYINGIEQWETAAGGISAVPQFMRVAIEVPWLPSHKVFFMKNDAYEFMVDYIRVYNEK